MTEETALLVGGAIATALVVDMLLRKTTYHVKETYRMQGEPQYRMPSNLLGQINRSYDSLLAEYRRDATDMLKSSAINQLTFEEKADALAVGENLIEARRKDRRKPATKVDLYYVYIDAMNACTDRINTLALQNHGFSLQRENISGRSRGIDHYVPTLDHLILHQIRTLQPATY